MTGELEKAGDTKQVAIQFSESASRKVTFGQNLEESEWGSAYRCDHHAPSGPFCLLKEPRTTSPERAPPTMGWPLPHASLMKKMSYRLAKPDLIGAFSLT